MWQSPFKTLPLDNQVVWVRVTAIYGELAVGTYNASAQTITTTVTGVVIPVYCVARWKPYP